MKTLVSLLVYVSCVLLLIGCAVGKPFVHPTHSNLTLNQTTQEQLVGMLGKPNKKSVLILNDEELDVLSYYYVPGHRDLSTGISPAATMFFYLWHDKLVRYEYTNSAGPESTDFDTALVERITKGSTTRDEVVGLIGEPGGYATFPGIVERDATAMIYFCEITTGTILGSNVHRKVLVLPCDQDGIVLDVRLIETGQPPD